MRQSGSVSDHIATARQALIAAGFCTEAAALDAEVLAREVLGWDRTRLLAEGRQPAPTGFADRYRAVIDRRVKHEPVALIAGHREFWDLDFLVTPATLIPRPETEFIVEAGLSILPDGAPATVLDIGTGTGCLAIALAHERPAAKVVATDVSHEALLVARRNAERHGVAGRVSFVRTELAAGLSFRANLIVSNPPYVPANAAGTLPPDVIRYEPDTALYGGPDGLDVIRRLLADSPAQLARDGRLVVEFGFGQEDAVLEIAGRTGWIVEGVLEDLQGIPRTIVLRR